MYTVAGYVNYGAERTCVGVDGHHFILSYCVQKCFNRIIKLNRRVDCHHCYLYMVQYAYVHIHTSTICNCMIPVV